MIKRLLLGLIASVFLVFTSTTLTFSEENGTGWSSPTPEELLQVKKAPASTITIRGILPKKVDLSDNFPTPSSQGSQGSCVGWATAYALKTYQEKIEHKWEFSKKTIFSPAFIYNQINGGRDRGSSPVSALQLIVSKGVCTWETMPYTSGNYTRQPSAAAFAEAAKYKGKSYAYINRTDTKAIKSHLAAGRALLIGMPIYKNFYSLRKSNPVYNSTSGGGGGGHAMCMVGYDDNKYGGAFKIINSWGSSHGDGGFLWIPYDFYAKKALGTYVLYDLTGGDTPVSPSGGKPGIPQNVVASSGEYYDYIKVSWSAVSGASSYEVLRWDTSVSKWDSLGTTTSTYYNDTKAKKGLSTTYILRAKNSSGYSKWSKTVRGMTKAKPDVIDTKPSAPENIVASAGTYSDRIVVTWQKVSGASSYYIIKYIKATSKWERLGKVSSTSYTDKAVKAGEQYGYRVCAKNKKGYGKWSDSATGYIKKSEPVVTTLSAPSLTVSQGKYSTRIDISWDKVSGATGYALYRWVIEENKWVYITSATGTSYSDTGLHSGSKIYYIANAYNEKLRSKWSKSVLGYTKKSVSISKPGTPQNFSASKGKYGNKVELTWTKTKGATGYGIYRYDSSKEKWVEISKTSSTTYSDSNVKLQQPYIYAAIAYNSAGYGNPSPWDSGFSASKISIRSAHNPLKNIKASQGKYVNRIQLTFGRLKGVDKYIILRNNLKEGSWVRYAEFEPDSAKRYGLNRKSKTIIYYDVNVEKGNKYQYRVAPDSIDSSTRISPVVTGWSK